MSNIKIESLYRLSIDKRDLGVFTIPQLTSLRAKLTTLLRPPGRETQSVEPIKRFIAIFAEEADLSGAELVGAIRTDRICLLRFIGIALALELVPGATVGAIAEAFHRDHSAVVHAKGALADRIGTRAAENKMFEELRSRMIKRFRPVASLKIVKAA